MTEAMTDVEIFKAAAEALGLPIVTKHSWERYWKNADRVWIHKDKCRDGSVYEFDPFLNADQRWECVRKLLEMGYSVGLGTEMSTAFYEGVDRLKLPYSMRKFNSELGCPAEEFPARALAALHRRQG